MKRLTMVLCAAVLAACLPAHADGGARAPAPSPYAGRVELSAISPELAHLDAMVTGGNDHIFGDVFKLSPSASNNSYTLALKSGATGAEMLNAYFYLDSGGKPGVICARLDAHSDGHGGETGTICPGENVGWAIVVLRAGAHATFTMAF